MMTIPKLLVVGFTALLLTSTSRAQYHKYDDWNENYTVQALLGAVQYNDLVLSETDSEGKQVEVDMALIPQLGGAWSTLPKGNRFQYGLECTFLVGFKYDKINYASAGGSGLHVSISTSMWLIDFSGGAYANLWLADSLRIYGGAGPLLIFSEYKSERSEDDGSTTDETYNMTESAFGVGLYGRTGIEFQVHERGYLGLGLRANWASVDFSDVGGNNNMSGVAAFLTYTAGL